MRRALPTGILACAALLLGPARAQPQEVAPVQGRTERLQRAFAAVVRAHRASVVSLWAGGNMVGYGTIVSDSGLILAPSEPLGAGDLECRLAPAAPRGYPARVLARNEVWNLALLQADLEEYFEPLAPGRDTDPACGGFVVSVGPGELPVAVGAVSAVGRAIVESEVDATDARRDQPAMRLVRGGRRYREVFQHDSEIGARAIGAPCFDSQGRFVGITVETRTRGTTYAIPARRVREILPELRAGRSTAAIRPGFLGISAGVLTPEAAATLGISGGVPIAGFQSGPEGRAIGAARAGLRLGDVIVAADGRAVTDVQTLQEVVQAHDPGERVALTVLREGRRLEAAVEVAERPRYNGR